MIANIYKWVGQLCITCELFNYLNWFNTLVATQCDNQLMHSREGWDG